MSGGLGRGQIRALREGQGTDLEASKALGGVRGGGCLRVGSATNLSTFRSGEQDTMCLLI